MENPKRSQWKRAYELKRSLNVTHISHIHHVMKKMAELFFIHSDFSLTPLLINDFSLNHKNLYYIHMHANSVLFYTFREKLDSKRSLEIFSHQDGFLHKHDSRLVWSDRLAFQKRILRWKWISKAPGRVAKICSFLCFNLKKSCCRKMVTNYN